MSQPSSHEHQTFSSFNNLVTFHSPNKEEDGTKQEPPKKDKTPKVPKAPVTSSALSVSTLHSLQELRRRLELAESGLTSHLHVSMGDNSVHECSVHIQKLQVCVM